MSGNIENIYAGFLEVEDFMDTLSYLKKSKRDNEATFLIEQIKKPLEIKTDVLWLDDVLNAYYKYLQAIFLEDLFLKGDRRDKKEVLIQNLQQILQVSFKKLVDLEAEVKKRLQAIGWYGTFKRSGETFSPYIWKKEEIIPYEVEMPHSTETIRVHFMENFVTKGWLSFFPKDLFQMGAFVENGEIYCLKEVYQPLVEKPAFQISLLKHETQHLLDGYFHLDDIHQEYRGKLVELYYYSNVSFLENLFKEAQSKRNEKQTVSHLILRDLQQYLLEVGIDNPLAYMEESTHSALQWVRNRGTIQQAALAILDRDTQKL